jgi:hypothetical protein
VASRAPPSSLAQVIILTVIPPGATGPNQTALTRKAPQPDLPRPYWTAEQKMSSHLLNSGKSDAACRRILAVADCATCVSEPLVLHAQPETSQLICRILGRKLISIGRQPMLIAATRCYLIQMLRSALTCTNGCSCWSPEEENSPRVFPYHGCALPTELGGQVTVLKLAPTL